MNLCGVVAVANGYDQRHSYVPLLAAGVVFAARHRRFLFFMDRLGLRETNFRSIPTPLEWFARWNCVFVVFASNGTKMGLHTAHGEPLEEEWGYCTIDNAMSAGL